MSELCDLWQQKNICYYIDKKSTHANGNDDISKYEYVSVSIVAWL